MIKKVVICIKYDIILRNANYYTRKSSMAEGELI